MAIDFSKTKQRYNNLMKARERMKKSKEAETPKQRKKRLMKKREWKKKSIEAETQEKRKERLMKKREWKKKSIEAETQEKRKERRMKENERKKKLSKKNREAETPEEQKESLMKKKKLNKKIREAETPEKQNKILTKKKDLPTIIETFYKNINVLCNNVCEICTKKCYLKQISSVAVPPVTYLPPELSKKSALLLCSRCKSSVTNRNKENMPSKAYWNNLDPGAIPEEIKNLTQAEKRLLARIIPHMKIIKYQGMFGQYGLSGQAILFAMNIFEVVDKISNQLPRSTCDTGLIAVVEKFEDINKVTELHISRERVMNALQWLMVNNPLYKDVIVNENVQLNINDMVRVVSGKTVQKQNMSQSSEHVIDPPTPYIAINNVARIIRASSHQGKINSEFAGMQCCAISLTNIIKAKIHHPSEWSPQTLDINLIVGDKLYGKIRRETPSVEIDNSGYLEIRHFSHIRDHLDLFNRSFAIDFDENTNLYGSLKDCVNRNTGGMKLIDALSELFRNHSSGILIASSKALGIMKLDDKFYFTDSHSCGPKGASAVDGKACIIQCDTLAELHRIIKRSTGSMNNQYTINYVDITIKDCIVNDENIQNDKIQPVHPSHTESLGVQTSLIVDIDYAHPDVEDQLDIEKNNTTIIKRKTSKNIVNDAHELKAEEFAWYYLFPYGINGLKEKRTKNITPLDYYQFRILGADTRFQRNDYLFYALSMYEFYKIKSNISACSNKLQDQRGNKIEDIHLYMKNIRGSAAYWHSALNELVAQIKCLGPPTYFVTFSCNDLNWLDMRKALLDADGKPDLKPEELTQNQTQRLIELYPVVVSRHFMVRVNALMNFIKQDDAVLGGHIIDFWWRIEFQNRGSPHLHMIVWVKDHPPIDTPEGIELIDKICKCELPPEEADLYQLVKKCQIHRHTATCRKNVAKGVTCRFNMPRPVCDQTHIVESTTEEFIKNGGRLCILKRRSTEIMVNNYNPILLSLWKGNMDIQPCGTNDTIAYYIAKYISKSEPSTLDKNMKKSIQEIQKTDCNLSKKLFTICMKIMKQRQVSACECVFRLCHLPLRHSSRKTIFLNTRKPAERYRMIKFNEKGFAIGYYSNIFEKYEKRPLRHDNYNFSEMPLIEFAMMFEQHYYKDNADENIDNEMFDLDYKDVSSDGKQTRKIITLLDNTKMIARNTPAVIRVPYFRADTDPENYFYSILLQYMPYRIESELLEGFASIKEAFLAREEVLKEKSTYMELYCQRDQQLQNAFLQVHAFQILEEVHPELIDEEEEDAPYENLADDNFQHALKAMNGDQMEIFKLISQSIQAQINGDEQRLRLFITGGAGVGKTFLLKLLREQINRCYAKDSVKVCALTGVAARLVNGATIHSMLKLPVQKDSQSRNMCQLTGNYLKIMRQQWKDIQFIIIDEISMVSYQMLSLIDLRLRQLKKMEDQLFGGINVLLFGDLLQLPPIRRGGTPVYIQPEHFQPATHLWRLFQLYELKENMRQQEDNRFAEMLNALRIGKMTSEHFSLLMDRILPDNPAGDFAIDKALRIYPTNKQVEEHNNAVICYLKKKKKIKMYTIIAQDQLINAARPIENVDLDHIISTDVNKTGGLPKTLKLFIGAKVMLRSNVDQKKGLVNGSIGFITEIIWPHFRKDQMYETDLPSVCVDFEKNGRHIIEPKSIQFQAKFSYGLAERRMLPMVLSWASTVHKLQGSTLDHAVVYLGPKLFEEGQAYVALSRVRSLDGLRIEGLDLSKLTGRKPCNNEALAELNRMRNISN